jgi:uncharacterized cupin superfamily protein
MFIQHDVGSVQLNQRDVPDKIVISGRPQVFGRVLSVSDDKRVARVAWRMTRGAVRLTGLDPDNSDLMYVLEGGCELRIDGEEPIVVKAGDWVECPTRDFEMHVPEMLHKISVIYNPKGLSLEVEP